MRARKLFLVVLGAALVLAVAAPAGATTVRVISISSSSPTVNAGTNALVRVALSGTLPSGGRASVRVFTVDGPQPRAPTTSNSTSVSFSRMPRRS